MIAEGRYIGEELALFEKAIRWKGYLKSQVQEYLIGSVLEVGAGIGGTTAIFCDGTQQSWTCLEPDPILAKELQEKISSAKLPAICKVTTSYLKDLPADKSFDAILYIDVIEHIENDKEELAYAAKYLNPGGALIIIVPAHQFLYSPFDKQIGHFRRYSRKRLEQSIPHALQRIKLRYLDSVGMLASLGNKMLLKSNMPTPNQIKFWDTTLVPLSTYTDRLSGYSIGKSVLGIWVRK